MAGQNKASASQVGLSTSPDRHTFQRDNYYKRAEDAGTLDRPETQQMLDYYGDIHEQVAAKEADPAWRENNMEYDLRSTDWMLEKVRGDDVYAQNLYAAMCNNDFQKNDFLIRLADKTWSCSWRYAGGIISDMQQKGDYIDWYCSGIRDTGPAYTPEEESNLTKDQLLHYKNTQAYVSESVVTDEVRSDLKRLGWWVVPEREDELPI